MSIMHLERSPTLPRPWCLSTDGVGLASTVELTTDPAPPTTTAPIIAGSMGRLTALLIPTEDTTIIPVADQPLGPTAPVAHPATVEARPPGVMEAAVQQVTVADQPLGVEDLAPGVE